MRAGKRAAKREVQKHRLPRGWAFKKNHSTKRLGEMAVKYERFFRRRFKIALEGSNRFEKRIGRDGGKMRPPPPPERTIVRSA